MSAICFGDFSKKAKELLEKYKKIVDPEGFPICKYDTEEEMITAIEEALRTGVPDEYDSDICY